MFRLLVPLLLLFVTAEAHARPGNPNRGRRHDPGHFFMRLSGGFGFSGAAFDDAAETTFRGAGGMGSFKFGATIARNVAIGADLFGLSMFEPNVEQGGRDLGSAENTQASLGALGIGGTFYVMPINLYFAASLGLGVGTVEVNVREGPLQLRFKEDTKAGFAANLMIGKEWWVARRWGLGLALQAILSSLETDEGDALGVFGVGVLFSATMN